MAHYAYLDDANTVVAVIVGKDENELINGLEPEIYYAQGTPYKVKRTSYNGKIRKNFAGIGYIYDEVRDAFISPQCHEVAIFDEITCRWKCEHDDYTPPIV
jgi:hypothetical protein